MVERDDRMIKHDINEKYSIAWFRISEYVMRGERERALGVYRLLSHSIHDASLIAQLEGDIFLFFGDTDLACQKYTLAAQGYVTSGRLINAVSLYEHLIILAPNKKDYILTLYTHASLLNTDQALHNARTAMIAYATRQSEFSSLLDCIIDSDDAPGTKYTTARTLFLSWIAQGPDANQKRYLETIVEYLVAQNNHEDASLFVSHIAPINSDLHTYGIALLLK